jgi:UDP-N-acetylglucosamine 4,6-dehydratase
MTSSLDGAGVLITGGTGSFGQAFVARLLATQKPRRVVIYSRDELKQYEMAQKLSPQDHPCLRYFIGDVRDEKRLRRAMVDIDTVVHAAALKHVPVAEYNPIEAINTNIFGSENVINASLDTAVERVIALSTDKAANPVNLYGATKLCADKLFVAANNLSGKDRPRFAVVRYGNVLGSRGSVLPLFQRLIAQGRKTVPITDARMTRFWITLADGVDFVLSSFEEMQGGETYVPKIPSMKITDLARALDPSIEFEEIGIRPGEKLHEVLIPREDSRNTLEFDDRFLIRPTGVLRFAERTYTIGGKQGRQLEETFEYRSDNNAQWMSTEDLHATLGPLAPAAQ